MRFWIQFLKYFDLLLNICFANALEMPNSTLESVFYC